MEIGLCDLVEKLIIKLGHHWCVRRILHPSPFPDSYAGTFLRTGVEESLVPTGRGSSSRP